MEMSFKQYIENPMGKKGKVFSQRGALKSVYTEKFDNIILREAGKFDYTMYYSKIKDEYFIHIKVPSEVVPNFYYDVVIQFYTKDPVQKTAPTIENYNARFYSNDPAFMFTYARVFLKNDMFIKCLKSKTPRKVLTQDPKETNPYMVPGYVKSLYFAFLYMKLRSLFSKASYRTYGEKFSEKALSSKVRPATKVIQERQEQGEKVAKDKRLKKQREASQRRHVRNESIPEEVDAPIRRTPTVHTTSKIGRVGSIGTGNIRTTKRTPVVGRH